MKLSSYSGEVNWIACPKITSNIKIPFIESRYNNLILAYFYLITYYKIPFIYVGSSFDLKNHKPDTYFEMCKERLETCDNIEWIPHLDNIEVLKLMSESTCLLSISEQESFGLTAVEALSVGTPVIYSAGNAVEEILSYQDVGKKLEFVPRTTWHTLGKLVKEAFDNIIDKYNPNLLRDYYLSRYTLSNMAKGYIKIYKSLLD